jgi:hypothetical protein
MLHELEEGQSLLSTPCDEAPQCRHAPP